MADEEKFETPYPRYNVLDKWNSPSFNEATRKVVAARLRPPPQRFFDAEQYALLRSVIETILPQPERDEKDRIAVEAYIDEKLHLDASDGTRYADLPPQREAWRKGLASIDREARRRFSHGFRELSAGERHELLAAIDKGDVDEDEWRGLPAKRFFRHILLKESVKIYYAHPYAWNEIGFGGPAAPRGYLRLGPDMRDPWEAEQERYPQRVTNLP